MNRQGRILIWPLGRGHDTIVVLPVLSLLERASPEAERLVSIKCSTSAKAAPTIIPLVCSSLIHESIEYHIGTMDPCLLPELRQRVRAQCVLIRTSV